jgi:hypothetical protein
MERIPGIKLLNLFVFLPTEDPLHVAHDEERLYLGTFSMPCTWHNAEPNPIQLPMNPLITALLGLPLKYDGSGIFSVGPRSHLRKRSAGKRC